ncbi:hypothetical protein PROVRUST_04579 [Providencia rustigianii DSM 4541]|uniref:Uncharacterized protein n=1 Tax=Providencia rustigianii DSM 4541 TaxID=500637 RepID=D1NXF1_9GAMM|nr:hypothetical protein PROVRUST_04579 [Providencia rustigianii DSM 4541]
MIAENEKNSDRLANEKPQTVKICFHPQFFPAKRRLIFYCPSDIFIDRLTSKTLY